MPIEKENTPDPVGDLARQRMSTPPRAAAIGFLKKGEFNNCGSLYASHGDFESAIVFFAKAYEDVKFEGRFDPGDEILKIDSFLKAHGRGDLMDSYLSMTKDSKLLSDRYWSVIQRDKLDYL